MNIRPSSPLPLGLTLLLALAGCMSRLPQNPRERPGLGTSWGETRESRVRSVAFERSDPDRPAAVTSLHYNDRHGLRAMTEGRGSWASAGSCSEPSAMDGTLHVHLLDEHGLPLPQLCQGGRRFVQGQKGERYTIEIENRGPGRIEAVATVDGLDVQDGRPGSFDKRGYLILPGATLRVEGFRRSLDEVAAFRFGAVADSYAAQKGQENNVGVIAVAFFPERGWSRPAVEREAERRRRADPFPGQFAAPPPRDWY